jgi:hypothetical protein
LAEGVSLLDPADEVFVAPFSASPDAVCRLIPNMLFKAGGPDREPVCEEIATAASVLVPCFFPEPPDRVVTTVWFKPATEAVPALVWAAAGPDASSLASSRPEPREARSDCQLERKLAAGEEASVVASPVLCVLAGDLAATGLCAEAPVAISIPVAVLMR